MFWYDCSQRVSCSAEPDDPPTISGPAKAFTPEGLLNSSNWQFTVVGPVNRFPAGPDSCTLPAPSSAGCKFNPPLPEMLPEKFIFRFENVVSTATTLKSALRVTDPAHAH